MGASHTTLAPSTDEETPPELEGNLLKQYAVDQQFFPSSGRILRTFRLKHKENSSTVVLKYIVSTSSQEAEVSQQEKELQRIKELLADVSHVSPYLYWQLGEYRPRGLQTVRPIALLRPHYYTTLSDRLASRPFLTPVEKLWITYQILKAADAIHSKGLVHGFLTAENVGLTSWNWVVLTDIASYKARTRLPDDDPSEYIYYFQEHNPHQNESTPREKRCYLAPERFYTPQRNASANANVEAGAKSNEAAADNELSPAMDMFSIGCVIIETFLNGERALDLGDLMDYRKKKSSPTLQQKMNKIEFSAVRAACRNMTQLEPSERLSASDVVDRLAENEVIPSSFELLSEFFSKATVAAPEKRVAILAAYYSRVLWESMGVRDHSVSFHVQSVLGEVSSNLLTGEPTEQPDDDGTNQAKSKGTHGTENVDIFAETEALLKRLENLNLEHDDTSTSGISGDSSSVEPSARVAPTEVDPSRSHLSKSSALIYLQLLLSSLAHLQRPASKIILLNIVGSLGHFLADEARLQRIIPVAVHMLQDQDPLVRASAIRLLSETLSMIESFTPSDSQLFPQYIFKRVNHLITDPSLVVRIAFAKTVGVFAECAQRFLDISHAVRLYEAIGGNQPSGVSSGNVSKAPNSGASSLFGEDVASLLDPEVSKEVGDAKILETKESTASSVQSDALLAAGKTVIKSTYNDELSAIQEVISRWVVHIATDQSEFASPVKRALLSDLGRICLFFRLDGVMAFVLPQLLTFLNDRKDWQLRAALFESLPSVCLVIGRAATEHFVMPCLETALVDGEETVVRSALLCFCRLLEASLLSRSALIGMSSTEELAWQNGGLIGKYGALLVHPSPSIRFRMIEVINQCCGALGFPDGEVFLVPLLRPFLRFLPTSRHLSTHAGLEMCLIQPWTRVQFQSELESILLSKGTLSPTEWTSVGFQLSNVSVDPSPEQPNEQSPGGRTETKRESIDGPSERVSFYLQLLCRSRTRQSQEKSAVASLRNAVEGSQKLSQKVRFPRQDDLGNASCNIPLWYDEVRKTSADDSSLPREYNTINSVSALGQVYGLSIMDQSVTGSNERQMTSDEARALLQSSDVRAVEAFGHGEWGAEACLDPLLCDTSLLVAKLNALGVPPLPPKLCETNAPASRLSLPPGRAGTKDSTETSKARIDTLIATSRVDTVAGHTAPVVRISVSHDQRFFVTGSHDGTCRVWETQKAERCSGILESSLLYEEHCCNRATRPRINDLTITERGHSVASASSDGSVRLWRVELVSLQAKQGGISDDSKFFDRTRVTGTSEVRELAPDEGEVLAIQHFNTNSASILTYGTQSGAIHTWDLRTAAEPFALKSVPGTGCLTSMATGVDRNWIVTGTNRGIVALWDMRVQRMVKIWHHSRKSPINRLAASYVPAPQTWGSKNLTTNDGRPFIFVASGVNECGMFDVSDGSCRECFRTVEQASRYSSVHTHDIPALEEISLSSRSKRFSVLTSGMGKAIGDVLPDSFLSVNAMVGSIGAMESSFLITGGTDAKIRFWDFCAPAKCYVSSGLASSQGRPSFERIDNNNKVCRLMICRQPPPPKSYEMDASKAPQQLFQGGSKQSGHHVDSIQDLKIIRSGLLSCSRDCTVKLWR